MTIGDQRAFPHEYKEPGNIRVVQEGMTYRQWLVGQIAGQMAEGYLKTPHQVYKEEGTLYSVTSEAAINLADAIIRRMEANE